MALIPIDDLDKIEYNSIRTNKKVTYINLEVSIDIETTSTIVNGDKVAFMYIWSIGLKNSDFVYHGRTWESLIEVCEQLKEYFKLKPDKLLVIYIQNLGYEFQFMRKYFNWVEVFSVDERKPIKAICDLGIEFRDSYILSGFSLEKMAKNLQFHKVEKLVGDLDYSLIRHSETEITDLELQYCKNDVIIVNNYINEQIRLYGDISKIPMTNTGRVRKYVRHNCYYTNKNHSKSSRGKFTRYRNTMNDLQIGKTDYQMLKRAFMGGFTHANANYSGKILEDVTSLDFTSSYPASMVTEKYPMSKAIPTNIKDMKDFRYHLEQYCLLFDIKFINLKSSIPQENYISKSKCLSSKNVVENNGRVFSADMVTMTITDVDFNIIENCYTWDSIEIGKTFKYHKGYLPKDIILSIIKLYEDKTVLKDVEGKEVEYVVSKGMLNSIYGMSVTDIIRDDIIYQDDKWGLEPADFNEQLEKYNKSYSRFLYYPWGVWITAYSRRNLWSGIYSMGEDYIYSDTDSVKFLNYDKHIEYINNYNNLVGAKLKAISDYYNIDVKKFSPKTKEGVVKTIGEWDLDGKYKRFKTLGAKRYLVEFETNDLEITIAGLGKKSGIEYMKKQCDNNTKVFNMFNDDLYIPADNTGKMTHRYIDSPYSFIIEDYKGVKSRVTTLSGIHLEPCEFTLSLTDIYIEFVNKMIEGYLFTGIDYQ